MMIRFALVALMLGHAAAASAQIMTGRGITGNPDLARIESRLVEYSRAIAEHQEKLNRLTELMGASNVRRDFSGPITWVVGVTQEGDLEYMEFPGVRCPGSGFLVGLDASFQPICEDAIRPIKHAGGGGNPCAGMRGGGSLSMDSNGQIVVTCNVDGGNR